VTAPFSVEQLGKAHDRRSFICGVPSLDEYFRTQATQDIKRHVANCFVLGETATGTVAGYYTLSSISIPLVDMPEGLAKKLPRYPVVPAVRMGRLAISLDFRRRGLGAALLADAATKALRDSAAAFALVVDAKDEQSAQFYEHEGFLRLESHPMTLFLPLATFRQQAEPVGSRRRV
jgi:GNAT superfamily N-acetyltransferase